MLSISRLCFPTSLQIQTLIQAILTDPVLFSWQCSLIRGNVVLAERQKASVKASRQKPKPSPLTDQVSPNLLVYPLFAPDQYKATLEPFKPDLFLKDNTNETAQQSRATSVIKRKPWFWMNPDRRERQTRSRRHSCISTWHRHTGRIQSFPLRGTITHSFQIDW